MPNLCTFFTRLSSFFALGLNSFPLKLLVKLNLLSLFIDLNLAENVIQNRLDFSRFDRFPPVGTVLNRVEPDVISSAARSNYFTTFAVFGKFKNFIDIRNTLINEILGCQSR